MSCETKDVESVPQASVAKSPALLSRFTITLMVRECLNHKNVVFVLCRAELPESLYEEILAPLDPKDPYLRTEADLTFSGGEVAELMRWFAQNSPECELRVLPATPIQLNVFSHECITFGVRHSGSRSLDGAPFGVYGVCDLDKHETVGRLTLQAWPGQDGGWDMRESWDGFKDDLAKTVAVQVIVREGTTSYDVCQAMRALAHHYFCSESSEVIAPTRTVTLQHRYTQPTDTPF